MNTFREVRKTEIEVSSNLLLGSGCSETGSDCCAIFDTKNIPATTTVPVLSGTRPTCEAQTPSVCTFDDGTWFATYAAEANVPDGICVVGNTIEIGAQTTVPIILMDEITFTCNAGQLTASFDAQKGGTKNDIDVDRVTNIKCNN